MRLTLFLNFLLLCFIGFESSAQQFLEKRAIMSIHYEEVIFNSNSTLDSISSKELISSVVISVARNVNIKGAFIVTGKDTFDLNEDLHDDEGQEMKFSQLVIFNQPAFSFIFVHEKDHSAFSFHLIHSGKTPSINARTNLRTEELCGKPSSIDQSEWRAGLPAPSYSPTYSTPTHLIVHHSAGSNTNTDYTNVVRQIYLYHTEVRHYSDIAYNFLIAQDGTIFEGREGKEVNEEDVVGAHFCAKNTGTMGVCLLGDYETASPTTAMLTSLEKILGWKLSKEKLNPFDVTPHPAGSSTLLAVIAGHRDGCETECPGKNVYDILSAIKQKSNEVKGRYETGTPMPELVSVEQKADGEATVTVSGGSNGAYLWFTSDTKKDSIPGAHNSVFTTPVLNGPTTYYVAIKQDECISELLAIEIKNTRAQIVLYPNPTEGDITISWDSSFVPEEITITNSLGQKISSIKPVSKQNNFALNTQVFTAGLYVFEFKNAQKSIKKRVIVRRS
jgi:hypothetical protein